ncbi:hypothetical protein KQX54_013268 [Cotesia glomerata]|uniref:SAM domain-containing protein n=1 Tax=Cotesia glomerata TaxID=32391 RepID=A0AAV7J1M2_COTGL|nr:hypothetical protein KQX54_013268 [Cotesia glomerata]
MWTLQETFSTWNIPTCTTKTFIDNGITLQLLKFLTDEDLEELCPDEYTKISLKKHIETFVLAHQECSVSNCSSNTSTVQPSSSSSTADSYSYLECPLCHISETTIKQHILHLTETHKKSEFPFIQRSSSSSNKSNYASNFNLPHTNLNHTFLSNSGSFVDSASSDINNINTNFDETIGYERTENCSNGSNYYFSEINKLISHMYNFLSMPRSLIQNLFKMIETFTLDLLMNVIKSLNDSSMPFEDKLTNISSIYIEIKNAFTQLGTEYRRIQHYQNSECYVEPRSTLWSDVMKQKENKYLILPLIVFYDDLETGNPLGSHAGINKLGAVYTSISTVPPTMSSRFKKVRRSRHQYLR